MPDIFGLQVQDITIADRLVIDFHIYQKEFVVRVLTTNNKEANTGPANKNQPKSTARTCNLNPQPLSTQTATTQTEYNESPPFNVVWRLMPDTPISRALNAAKCYISNDEQEARALLAHVLEQETSWLFTNHDYQLNIQQIERYTDLIRRRIANEPLEDLINVQV